MEIVCYADRIRQCPADGYGPPYTENSDGRNGRQDIGKGDTGAERQYGKYDGHGR